MAAIDTELIATLNESWKGFFVFYFNDFGRAFANANTVPFAFVMIDIDEGHVVFLSCGCIIVFNRRHSCSKLLRIRGNQLIVFM